MFQTDTGEANQVDRDIPQWNYTKSDAEHLDFLYNLRLDTALSESEKVSDTFL